MPDGPHNALTYFGRLGISHRKLGMRMEVSTQDISILHNGKKMKLLWSDAASIKDNEWVSLLCKHDFEFHVKSSHFLIYGCFQVYNITLTLTQI